MTNLIATRGTQLKRSPFMAFVQGVLFKVLYIRWNGREIPRFSEKHNSVWLGIAECGIRWLFCDSVDSHWHYFDWRFESSRKKWHRTSFPSSGRNDNVALLRNFFWRHGQCDHFFPLSESSSQRHVDVGLVVGRRCRSCSPVFKVRILEKTFSLSDSSVGCGGVQKFASLNKFNNKIHQDVLIISVVSYLFYMCTGIFSFMYMAELGRFYYPNLDASERIDLYTSPVLIEVVISEVCLKASQL